MSDGGTPFIVHVYELIHDGREFNVQTTTYPSDVDVSDPRAILENALAENAAVLAEKKWDKISWMQLQGSPAVELIGAYNDNHHARNYYILKGRQLYAIGYAGPPGTLQSDDANRFFGSFRILSES